MKRLRARIDRRISYFMCGEYGTKLSRPHYHAIIFGMDFAQDRIVHSRKRGTTLWRSPMLESLWPYGFSSIGSVTFQSAAYVARYSLKKVTGERSLAHYAVINPDTGEIFQRVPEFVRMSLKPAIGKNWFNEFESDVYPDDFCLVQGKKVRTPAYYDRLLEAKNPELLARVKAVRRWRAKQHEADNTPERLAVKAELNSLRLRNLKREFESS